MHLAKAKLLAHRPHVVGVLADPYTQSHPTV